MGDVMLVSTNTLSYTLHHCVCVSGGGGGGAVHRVDKVKRTTKHLQEVF